MDAFSGLANLFGNALPPIQRFFNLIILIGILLWVDGQMGFTYHYFSQRKIDEISSYNALLKDTSLDSNTRAMLMKERTLAITKKRMSASDYASFRILNGWQFILSCNWLMILIILIIPKALKEGNPYTDKKTINWQTIVTLFIFTIGAILGNILGYFTNGFLAQKIFMIIWNTVIQIVIVIGIVVLSLRATKKQQQANLSENFD